jgi:hypothetical protein
MAHSWEPGVEPTRGSPRVLEWFTPWRADLALLEFCLNANASFAYIAALHVCFLWLA